MEYSDKVITPHSVAALASEKRRYYALVHTYLRNAIIESVVQSKAYHHRLFKLDILNTPVNVIVQQFIMFLQSHEFIRFAKELKKHYRVKHDLKKITLRYILMLLEMLINQITSFETQPPCLADHYRLHNAQ